MTEAQLRRAKEIKEALETNIELLQQIKKEQTKAVKLDNASDLVYIHANIESIGFYITTKQLRGLLQNRKDNLDTIIKDLHKEFRNL